MSALGARETVKSLWEAMFDANVNDDENFFDRGDSLMALILLASIEKEAGVRVEFAQLVEAPTIAGLARLVGRDSGSGR